MKELPDGKERVVYNSRGDLGNKAAQVQGKRISVAAAQTFSLSRHNILTRNWYNPRINPVPHLGAQGADMIRNAQDQPILLAIHGAAGRMGRRLIALAVEDPQWQLAAALDAPGQPLLGQDAGVVAGVPAMGVPITDKFPPAAAGIPAAETLPGLIPPGPGAGTGASGRKIDVMIDFSVPAAFRQALQNCTQTGVSLVVGTTGLTAEDHRAIDEAAKTIAILQAPNMSLGVNLMLGVVAQVARALGDDYDIEITEAHHRFKKDAPSGTALALAQAICAATGKDPRKDIVHGRQGDDVPRVRGQIGMHALRLGDVVGEHTVRFATLGERLEVTHLAGNRDIFARGALTAAKWLADRRPGRYTMQDVLGLGGN